MLIQKDTKPERCRQVVQEWFESFANSERYKTYNETIQKQQEFESFANSERYKTLYMCYTNWWSLRALLIQKDTKHK